MKTVQSHNWPLRRLSQQRRHQHVHLGQSLCHPVSDYTNAKIKGQPVTDVITDTEWLQGEFIATVQQRGAAIIAARGASSAASAANGVVDTVRSLTTPTPEGDWTSVCVCSDGSYGIDAGLIASMPIRVDGRWSLGRSSWC